MFWLISALALAVLHWISRWHQWRWVYTITKPAVLIAVIIWSFDASGWQGEMIWFGLALVFSLVGDVILLLPPKFFLGGLATFLIAHILYIIGLNLKPLPINLVVFFLFAGLFLLDMVFMRRVRRGLKLKAFSSFLQIPVQIYSVVIGLMLFSALLTLMRPEWSLVAALWMSGGAVLFVVSDFLLAFDRFFKKIPKGPFWIMIAYHLGQIAITTGALMNFGEAG